MSLEKIFPALVKARLDALMRHCGLRTPPGTRIECDGPAPGCRPAVGEAAAVALAAVGSAAALLWESRGGAGQSVRVSTRQAAASLRSYTVQTLDGISPGRRGPDVRHPNALDVAPPRRSASTPHCGRPRQGTRRLSLALAEGQRHHFNQ